MQMIIRLGSFAALGYLMRLFPVTLGIVPERLSNWMNSCWRLCLPQRLRKLLECHKLCLKTLPPAHHTKPHTTLKPIFIQYPIELLVRHDYFDRSHGISGYFVRIVIERQALARQADAGGQEKFTVA